MSAPALVAPAPSVVSQHAALREYAQFVRQRSAIRVGYTALKAARAFVRAYPDLGTWFGAPLAERVGIRRAVGGLGTSANARPYLYFLARQGLARFDYEWILGVGTRVLPDELLDPEMAQALQALLDGAVALGYERGQTAGALRRVIRALYLHLLASGVMTLNEANVDELARAVRAFADRPDAARYYGSLARCRGMVADYRCGLHALRVLLYHRGQIATEPHRQRATKAPRPSPRPAMEATVDRYLRAPG